MYFKWHLFAVGTVTESMAHPIYKELFFLSYACLLFHCAEFNPLSGHSQSRPTTNNAVMNDVEVHVSQGGVREFPRQWSWSAANWGLKATAVCSLTVLRASGLEARCWQGWSLPETLKEDLFCGSLPASGGGCQSLVCLGL